MKRKVEIVLEYFKIKYNKILKFLFRRPAYTKEQKELFEQLKMGDVIYARMPLSDRTMATIGKGHQNRPYLVVSTQNDVVCAYPCSHKRSYSYSYALKKEAYPFYNAYGKKRKSVNDSWILFKKPHYIPIGNIYYCSFHVHDYDLSEIERKLVMKKNKKKRDMPCLNYPYEIRKGDILLKDNQFYYVYSKDKKKLFVHTMKTAQKEEDLKVQYKKTVLSIQIQEKKEILWDESCKLLAECNQALIDKVDLSKKREKRANKKIQRISGEKKQRLAMLSFQYPSGTLFYHPFYDEYILYLFNLGAIVYGLHCNDIDEGEYLLRRISFDKYYLNHGVLEKNELEEIVQNMLQYGGDFYGRECCEVILEKYCKEEVIS